MHARRVRGLAVHEHEPVHRGGGGEHEHDPQHRHDDVERERDAEEHEPLGALHQPAARVEAERLGARPLVRHEHRARRDREREDRLVRRPAGEVPGDAAEQQRVGHAVGDGVEERAARAGLAAPAGDRAVEQVADAGDDHADDRPREVARPDEDRGRDRGEQAEDGQRVGRDTDAAQAPAERAEAPLDAVPPASVEHAGTPLGRSRAVARHRARAREHFEGTTALRERPATARADLAAGAGALVEAIGRVRTIARPHDANPGVTG